MKIKFQVIRDGDMIFEKTFDKIALIGLPGMTELALAEYEAWKPEVSLFDEDVILKWSEADE